MPADLTPEKRAAEFKRRWWTITRHWSRELDEADLVEVFSDIENEALEKAALKIEKDGDWGHSEYFARTVRSLKRWPP